MMINVKLIISMEINLELIVDKKFILAWKTYLYSELNKEDYQDLLRPNMLLLFNIA
jgi:hypothetical protein